MQRVIIPAMIVVGAVFVACVIMLVMLMNREPSSGEFPLETPGASALTPDRITRGLAVPAFTLTDQDGRPVTEEAFDGRITILDFIFTDCVAICPMMTGVVSELAKDLADTPVRIVSISVNPERDTPERLREYGEKFGANLARWSFLTGDYAVVRQIVHDALMFEIRRDPARMLQVEDGLTTWNVVHPGKLLLVGPDRQILGMYEYSLEHEVDALRVRARKAVASMTK